MHVFREKVCKVKIVCFLSSTLDLIFICFARTKNLFSNRTFASEIFPGMMMTAQVQVKKTLKVHQTSDDCG